MIIRFIFVDEMFNQVDRLDLDSGLPPSKGDHVRVNVGEHVCVERHLDYVQGDMPVVTAYMREDKSGD